MKLHILSTLFICLLASLFVLPLILLFIQACIPMGEAVLVAQGILPLKLLPLPFSLEQFSALFSAYEEFWKRVYHDLAWSSLAATIQVFVSIVNGYILSKYKNRYSEFISVIFTLAVIMPVQVFLIPIYRITRWAGLANCSFILYLPLAFAPLGSILMRQVNLRLPDECVEHLRLEGGDFRQLLFYVVIPFCQMPALVLFLFSFVECWGMVEYPLILLTNKADYPLSMLLYDMRVTQPQIIYAASAIALMPIIAFVIVYVCQRKCLEVD